jgi:hypothetical protein
MRYTRWAGYGKLAWLEMPCDRTPAAFCGILGLVHTPRKEKNDGFDSHDNDRCHGETQRAQGDGSGDEQGDTDDKVPVDQGKSDQGHGQTQQADEGGKRQAEQEPMVSPPSPVYLSIERPSTPFRSQNPSTTRSKPVPAGAARKKEG